MIIGVRLKKLEELKKEVGRPFNKGCLIGALDKWQMDVDAAIIPNISGKILDRRSGQMARGLSWAYITSHNDFITLTLNSKSPQARLLEYGTEGLPGGVLKPVNAEYLTIPLPAAMTPGGVLKKSATEWDNTFVQKSKKGNLIIFQTKSKKKKKGKKKQELVPLFVLKKEVEIEPKRWFSISVNEALSMLKVRLVDEEKMSV